jgi:hypothetical protein
VKALLPQLGAQQNHGDKEQNRPQREPFPPVRFDEAAFPEGYQVSAPE